MACAEVDEQARDKERVDLAVVPRLGVGDGGVVEVGEVPYAGTECDALSGDRD